MTPHLPAHSHNPETTHEEPVYLFTDRAVVPDAAAPAEGHPLLAALLAALPRLRRELPGWAPRFLVPALNAFPEDAAADGVHAALDNLRTVLRRRADVDPWLGDIAVLGTAETAVPRTMTPASQLPGHVDLSDRLQNRTIVAQARRLAAALTAPPAKPPGRPTPPPPRPDTT